MRSVMKGKDALVIMPTAAGKSVCFQAPALLLGLTLVISPLLSLMRDQVKGLQKRGIAAAHLGSDMEPREKRNVWKQLESGKLKLLYVSPERLDMRSFVLDLQQLRYKVQRLVVDEAHCVSEWGHDFREEYRKIGLFASELQLPVQAFTATANEKTQRDIKKQLGLVNPACHLTQQARLNLIAPRHLAIRQVKSSKMAFNSVLTELQQHPLEAGIIFCSSKKAVDQLYDKLRQNSWRSSHRVGKYHADLEDDERTEVSMKWQEKKLDVVVASCAFGMGIDRPDARFVIHVGLPNSVAQYYQEVGRAGRDGLISRCTLYHYGARSYLGKKRVIKNSARRDQRESKLKELDDLWQFCQAKDCRHRRVLRFFGPSSSLATPCGACDCCGFRRPGNPKPKETAETAVKVRKVPKVSKGPKAAAAGDDSLREAFRELRRSWSKKQKLRPYCIFSDRALEELCAKRPSNEEELLEVWGFGDLKVKKYGPDILHTIESVSSSQQSASAPSLASLASAVGGTNGEGQSLSEALMEVRSKLSRARSSLHPSRIFSDNMIAELCVKRPANMQELLQVKGFGEVKVRECCSTYC